MNPNPEKDIEGRSVADLAGKGSVSSVVDALQGESLEAQNTISPSTGVSATPQQYVGEDYSFGRFFNHRQVAFVSP